MNPTPRLIKENELPLEFVGYEKETNKSVYKLTGMLNVDIQLSLKYSGYARKDATLSSGEVVEGAWVK